MITEQMVGQFHPIILHFPIVLFTAALVCDITYYFGKAEALNVGHWMIILAVITCIPTILTGLAAALPLDPNNPIVEKHRSLGYSTGIFGSLYAGLRIAAMAWEIPLKAVHFVGLSVLMVALVSWTSDYGGLITRGTTPFSSPPDHEVAHADGNHRKQNEEQQISPIDLEKQLERMITVRDVTPIFSTHNCQSCHSKEFSPDGKPLDFFTGDPKFPFLVKNADGSLKDFASSNFYKTVLMENQMPMDMKGNSIGLGPSDRLILLLWLKNGAPMN